MAAVQRAVRMTETAARSGAHPCAPATSHPTAPRCRPTRQSGGRTAGSPFQRPMRWPCHSLPPCTSVNAPWANSTWRGVKRPGGASPRFTPTRVRKNVIWKPSVSPCPVCSTPVAYHHSVRNAGCAPWSRGNTSRVEGNTCAPPARPPAASPAGNARAVRSMLRLDKRDDRATPGQEACTPAEEPPASPGENRHRITSPPSPPAPPAPTPPSVRSGPPPRWRPAAPPRTGPAAAPRAPPDPCSSGSSAG